MKKIELNDRAVFDFTGYMDGEKFAGGSSKGFTMVIGSGDFIPGFEDEMIGMEQGEEKDIYVTFPDNYHATEFAGKEAKFVVLVHSIKKKK